jgi:glutamate synthase domain-containing protein 2
VTRLSNELAGMAREARGPGAPSGAPGAAGRAGARLGDWEQVLVAVVDPESPRLTDPGRTRALLEHLVRRAGVEPDEFWALDRARRGHLVLQAYARPSRDVPSLELTAFDIDKLLKERFRREPLTVGAAWHHGYWRSYFSHAAITHPANDGLREEFSTGWDIARKRPAVVFHEGNGRKLAELSAIRLDMPLIVGPLPFGGGVEAELAYLEAVAAADEAHDIRTRTLVVVEADKAVAHADALAPHAADLVVRLAMRHAPRLGEAPIAELVRGARLVELDPGEDDLEALAAAVRAVAPDVLLSVFLRYDGDGFWPRLEAATRHDGVALVHYHSGPLKSYRLTPRVDAFLKERLLRARVQLVASGGDTDTQASAATVFEAVLLGANGGAMTHAAAIALAPEAVDALEGGGAAAYEAALAAARPGDLREMALCSLTCWQHSVLDFLSCMGIDDVQKTSGNTMAITMTEDWVRDVDALATDEFGRANADVNRRRVAAEPVPAPVRDRYRVSRLLSERSTDLPMVNAARVLAQRDASYHLGNSSRALNADFLEVIYRMAAGAFPELDDFFVTGDQGPYSLDRVGLRVSRESVAWSLARLRRDPALLDYVSLAVPRGFVRPGAVAPGASVSLHATPDGPALLRLDADARGGFAVAVDDAHPLAESVAALDGGAALTLRAVATDGSTSALELAAVGHGAHGAGVVRASADGAVVLKRDPRGGLVLSGLAIREPIWHGPVCHASTSLGAASEDFLVARVEGNAGLTMTSSGEGGPLRLSSDDDMKWESLQAASGHFGITGADLRKVRDVEIKINQGAKPGKGGRLSGAKVTPTVSKARNIPVGTDALSPDPKHDIYSIEDMPAEVWLWLLYHNHCGIKITGSTYTKYVAAGMWSNFVVDYLLIDSGLGGSGNYHADSSHVGWPDIFRTILHTHHALIGEKVDLDGSGELRTIRDLNGAPFGAQGGTRLFASGGLRGELDMLKVLIAGADALYEASIGKAVAFGCTQCGNCHLDCPRGGITTKQELMVQNDRELMTRRSHNWSVLNLAKLAVLVDALNRESGALDPDGTVVKPDALIDDIRLLRGRVDLLEIPVWDDGGGAGGEADDGGAGATAPAGPRAAAEAPQPEHDSCRVGSLAVSTPVTVDAIWEAARLSYNGGNNRGGGIDFAGFAPAPVRDKTCLVVNTIGPDRDETLRAMLGHFGGCRFFAADGAELGAPDVLARRDEFRLPVRERYSGEDGWRLADLREDPGDFHLFFVDLDPAVVARYGRRLVASPDWLQRRTKYGDLDDAALLAALDALEAGGGPSATASGAPAASGAPPASGVPSGSPAVDPERLAAFVTDVREEYFTVLGHVVDSRFYRTHTEPGAPAGKYAPKRRGYLVSMGQDLAAVKISGWTHTIPEYFAFDRFWAGYPGTSPADGPALRAHVWGMHHRYPTNSPAIDAEGRGNPAGAHPFKAYNVLLMHNGEQVGVDSTSPFLREFGFVHADESMGDGWGDYERDSVYDRKALTDTEYAAYLVDFTRRVLGLPTEEASQVISPITGLDLAAMDDERRRLFALLSLNYVQLTPTGPYKFTIVESRPAANVASGAGGDGRPALGDGDPGAPAARRVGFRENMDIKFLRPHELVVSADSAPGGARAVANGSEAKIADAMLRVLHDQGVLKDAGHDLRFNMRPGGNPGRGEFGGVVEAFLTPGSGELDLVNRFGEPVDVPRAGTKTDLAVPAAEAPVTEQWRAAVAAALAAMAAELPAAAASADGRFLGPDDALPAVAARLVDDTLARLATLSGDDYRHLVEVALPGFARQGDAARALALRLLTELRKRVAFCDLGGKALSGIEYVTDGGRRGDGSPEGGVYRLLDEVTPLHDALHRAATGQLALDASSGAGDGADPAAGVWGRLTFATRDDLVAPLDPARDVLVLDFAGFESEAFGPVCASTILADAVRLGWKNVLGYGCVGGPRYLGVNLADAEGASARGVTIELFGREVGDFLGALLEGADIRLYGQGQCHAGMKAAAGSIFVLQDALNTCCYAAHGGTFNVWDSGSRFAVAGQNKVYEDDGETLAQGFKSIHFGTPNEYAFEYLMSGGENSLHVVMGLSKPAACGELGLRAKPYFGKFFMSGAAAGRVFVFDPEDRLDPAQYHGNVLEEITPEDWRDDLAPFVAAEAAKRGAPIRVEGDELVVRLDGAWRRWRYDACFIQLVPQKVSRRLAKRGVTPPQLAQLVEE